MYWTDIPGWFDFEQLYRAVAEGCDDNSILVEIGCWRGRSIAFLAAELMQRGKRPALFAVDTWGGSPGETEMDKAIAELGGPDGLYRDFIKNMDACGVREMLLALRMPSIEAAKLFDDGAVGFAFIDGEHTTEAVRADIRAWLPKMHPVGTIAGHDFAMPSVAAAVREAFGTNFEVFGSCWIVHRAA